MTSAARGIDHLIRTDDEYNGVVEELERLIDRNPQEGSPADERIAFLSLLVEDYDARHHVLPGPAPTPRDVVSVFLEMRGMKRSDLTTAMGGRSRVSEFFNGTRALSMSQVIKLRALLEIPADLLISDADASE
jgi:HTH-type transcriptional regulator/antitoxin HigA